MLFRTTYKNDVASKRLSGQWPLQDLCYDNSFNRNVWPQALTGSAAMGTCESVQSTINRYPV